MDGFNVLNETAGHHDLIVLGVVLAVVAGLLMILGVACISTGDMDGIGIVIIALLVALFSGLAFSSTQSTRYEVTLKPGAVIDATRWDIVEHRGEIYVIQERKPDAD